MPNETINVAIVDDLTFFRKTLKHYISQQNNINVVIQSPDINDLLAKLKNTQVDVLVLDIITPQIDAIEAIETIQSIYPDINILVLSMCIDMDLLSDLLNYGVYGILSRTDEPEDLVQAILSVSRQKLYRSKIFTEVMYWNKQHCARKHTGTNVSLNEREKEVIQLLWEEKSNKEIAEHLYLSVRSVEKVRQDIKEKLNVKSTAGLFKYGIKNKIIRVRAEHPTY